MPLLRRCRRFLPLLWALWCIAAQAADPISSGNRLTILDEFCDIYYPDHQFPKLTTPQWVGEEGVDAVIVLAIDDMREHGPYEAYLRPILERLKRIDGRAPVSIMANAIDPNEPHLQQWLAEGVSLETHTTDHPCPILARGNFEAAKSTYDRCVDHFFSVPNNHPVAFRTPCMDGINSVSPRLFAEILLGVTPQGHFLTMSSSIGVLFTLEDPELPRELVLDESGKPRFEKYLLGGYLNYIRNYPYPYLIGNRFWEAPFSIPDDYEGFRAHGEKSPQTVEDMKAAIDLAVAKQGIWVMTFHPYAWIGNDQVISLIDHVVARHGRKVKVLNFRDVQERIDRNLLLGQSTRSVDGGDNGVRLLDLNGDGYQDVVVANDSIRRTRIWDPTGKKWRDSDFPVALVTRGSNGATRSTGGRFGILQADGLPCLLVANETARSVWQWNGQTWVETPALVAGLEIDGQPVLSSFEGRDRGVRFRDLDGDGLTELLVSNPDQRRIFQWSVATNAWQPLGYALPKGVSLVNELGRDHGVRFVDFNQDGHSDLIASNEERFGLWLFVPHPFLGFQAGWSRAVITGRRGERPQIPMITQGGANPNYGAWFAMNHLWVQNEDTAQLPDLVDRVSFEQLLNGLQPPPRDPTNSLAAIQVAPEHVVELVAHEPTVRDPVAMAWGADGTFWVVEMGDYPMGIDGRPGGVVKRLRDADGDGFYESAQVFAENLNFPNGIMPWREGVLVSAAPDLLFLRDENGDGRADRSEVLFTGFGQGNQQHRFNGFELGLDNWIYGANGDSGGKITSTRTGQTVDLSGRDFRFRPDTGEFLVTSGQTQFGRRRDDWGNWFGGANPVLGWHYFIDERYAARNPHLALRTTHRLLARYPDAGRVFPISRVQQRFNDVGMAGHVTSAATFGPYRDSLFGTEFERSIFIAEPSHNLVHREQLEPAGVSFTAVAPLGELASRREFLASQDPWFRPVNVATGPDGALYVADMYRLVIEHPEWIPDDVKARIDVRAGSDLGRIYRVRPRDQPLRLASRLDQLSPGELVRAMDSRNGWQRDTVQRLLLEQRPPEAVPALTRLATEAAEPRVRLQALCTLEGLDALSDSLRLQAMRDAHPAIREHAVRMLEPLLERGSVNLELERTLLALADDPAVRVRYQLALSLGYWNDAKAANTLATLANRDANDEDMITAILTSAAPQAEVILARVLESPPEGKQAGRIVEGLVQVVARRGQPGAAARILSQLAQNEETEPLSGWKLRALASLLNAAPEAVEPTRLKPLVDQARSVAVADSAALPDRIASLRLLGRVPESQSADLTALGSLLTSRNPLELQQAALARCAELPEAVAGRVLLERWRDAGPQLRSALGATLLRRAAWAEALLDQVEQGQLAVVDLGAAVRQELLAHHDESVRQRAQKLLSISESSRRDVVATAVRAVTPLAGDSEKGRLLFDLQCASCHRAGAIGTGAGPNLAMLYDHDLTQILTAILDPNQAVEDKYWSYTAELRNGDLMTGLLLNETGNSITLMAVNGTQETVLRQNLQSLTSGGRSMMPEGFEQFLSPQALADLTAFISASAAPARRFAGNQPTVIQADEQGALRLTAATAEIYGEAVAFEAHYRNLGLWNGANDRAVWTVEVPAAGEYRVWLDWACQNETSGNGFVLSGAEAPMRDKVPGTGTWDAYRQKEFGRVRLSAGRHRLAFKADAGLRGHLIDLREIRLVPLGAGEPKFAAARPGQP